jgi:hypothetical protein
MLNISRAKHKDGRDLVAVNDPNPGAYTVVVQSTAEEPSLEIEEFVS